MKIKRRLMLLVLSAMMLFGCVTTAYAFKETTISAKSISLKLYGYLDYQDNAVFADKIWYTGMMTGTAEAKGYIQESGGKSFVYITARTNKKTIGTVYLNKDYTYTQVSAKSCGFASKAYLDMYCYDNSTTLEMD